MREPGLGKQALWLAGASGAAQVLVALLYLFAARGSEPHQLGLIVSAIGLATSAAGFIDFGTNSHWLREVASGRLPWRVFERRLATKLVVSLALSAVWLVVVLLVAPTSELWVAGPVTIALLANQTLQVPLRAAARGDLAALVVLADRLGAGVAFAVLIVVRVPPVGALWIALTLGSLGAAVLAWAIAPPAHRPRLFVRALANPWEGSRYFGLAVVANSAQALDLTVLTGVAGPTATGVYGAVNRWTQPMALLASAFASASAPYAARSRDVFDAWRHLRRGLWMPLTAIGLSVVVFALAPWVVDFLLGAAYRNSAAALQLLALAVIPSIICQPVTVALQALGRDRFVAFAMVATALVQLVLVVVLGRASGALGAAQASLIVQMVLILALAGGVLHEVGKARRNAVDPASRSAG
ncbi:polysaccharide biosynthesis C-terminal domain-containing protein [Curtobacterium sp. MCBD17_035]|uniref:lipopolysaccharide biosynthesis protein n=1 Tax=Curtobacterium sp. MCBD17_035 TaxID=2175673 RepID=UPI000DAA18F1|nr:polysaccharide biosynthesis C-terminal domain-containing protein [Curtobacterium sp. MCBD17_035]WIB67966.1 polysaccharide biosynthesis C-terminal domain-containing protein [Curtobacterium sp. MCBD17_035]